MKYVLDRSLKLGWGIGALGSSTLLYANAFLLLYFMTDQLAIAPAVAGTLIFASKVYDAFTDPLVGMMSDRSRGRWGRRRPFMLVGALVCAISGMLLYNVPAGFADNAMLVYLVAILLLYATGYTLFNVPYLAMPAEMTDSPDERTSLMSYRVGFVAVGGICGTALAPMLIGQFGGDRSAYGVMGWLLGALVGIAMLAAVLGTRRAAFTEHSTHSIELVERIRLIAQNRPFCLLMAAKLLQLVGLSSVLASMPYFVLQVMQKSEMFLGVYGIALNVATIASMPIWVALSKNKGKKFTYSLSVVAYAISLLSWLLAGSDESLAVFALRAAVMGLASGGILLMGTAMLPDTIELDYRRSGLRREGIFSGVYSLVEKTAFALAPLIVGLVLSAMGYVESGAREVAQSQQALSGVYISLVGIPVAAALLSLVFLSGYNLTAETA
jgi:GPH family glycoside/pentoside/hexuronide:cation symporter